MKKCPTLRRLYWPPNWWPENSTKVPPFGRLPNAAHWSTRLVCCSRIANCARANIQWTRSWQCCSASIVAVKIVRKTISPFRSPSAALTIAHVRSVSCPNCRTPIGWAKTMCSSTLPISIWCWRAYWTKAYTICFSGNCVIALWWKIRTSSGAFSVRPDSFRDHDKSDWSVPIAVRWLVRNAERR